MFVQRFGSAFQLEKDYIDGFISLKHKYENSFDEVWLSTSYGFPPLEVHKDYAKKLELVAERLRNEGINVSMQLANSIGHGSYVAQSYDCSGLSEGEYKAQPLIGHDGSVGIASYCWHDDKFRDYLFKELELYCSAVKPNILWVDDDFRAFNHFPVNYGCFCPDCIKKFNEKHGYNFQREDLVESILHKNISVRKEWIDFIREGLGQLMLEMCKVVKACSPNTEFGLQNFCNGAYTGFGLDFILDAMRTVSGKEPHYRAGGGTYKDHNPNDIVLKNMYITFQHSMMPKSGYRVPEIENSPDIAFGKTPAGTAFETSYYLANGANGMTYAMMMNLNEPISWHENEFKLFNVMRPYWDKLVDVSNKTDGAGITLFMSKNAYAKKLNDNDGFDELSNEFVLEGLPLFRLGFPLVFDDCNNVCFLHPEIAKYISEEEFNVLKNKNVITCGESAAILNQRGFKLPIQAIPLNDYDARFVKEGYTEHYLNGNLNKWFNYSSFENGRFKPHYLEFDDSNALTLGKLIYKLNDKNPLNGKVSTAIIPINKNTKWAVFGYSLWGGAKNFTERERVLNIADYISGGLGARILSCEQAILNIRKDSDGKIIAVSVTNCTIGKLEDVKVLIRNPISKNVVFEGQYEKEQKLDYFDREDGIIVNIPEIAPWSVSTIFLK